MCNTNKLKFSDHACRRINERNIREKLIEATINYGKVLSQNPSRIIFGHKECEELKKRKSMPKQEILELEYLLHGRTVVVVIGNNELITIFWATKRINKRSKK